MKKLLKFIGKLLGKLTIITGILFTIYITNLDSKLVEVIYDALIHFHSTKKVEDKI